MEPWAPPPLLLVLAAIGEGERYGYDIVSELRSAGLADLNEATVYTVLRRLESNGLARSQRIEGESGRPRRYYRLTPRGTAELDEHRVAWARTKTLVDRLLEGG